MIIFYIYNMYIMRIFYKRIVCTCLCLCFQQARLHSYHLNHTRGARTRPSRGPVLCFLPGGDGEYQMKLRVKGETADEGWVNMSFLFFQTQTYPLVMSK